MFGSAPLRILIYEWATGGLAGVDVPRSWRAEGRAMRRSVALDFAAIDRPSVRVTVALGRSEPPDMGPWKSLRLPGASGLDELIEKARRADYTLVIAPETTGILARLARELDASGARSLGCQARAVELTGDKLRLMEWLQGRGIPTPHSRLIPSGQEIPRDIPLPAVLKPIDGAGSVDTFLLTAAAEIPPPGARPFDALIQPFREGIPMSASFLVAANGTPWLIGAGRQRIRVSGGRFSYCGGVVPVPCPRASPLLRRALESIPGLRGFVGVDFLWDPEEHAVTVLEVNPRPTTSYVGLVRLLRPGRLARAWLACLGAASGAEEDLAALEREVQERPPLGFSPEGTVWPEVRG